MPPVAIRPSESLVDACCMLQLLLLVVVAVVDRGYRSMMRM